MFVSHFKSHRKITHKINVFFRNFVLKSKDLSHFLKYELFQQSAKDMNMKAHITEHSCYYYHHYACKLIQKQYRN